MLFVTTVIAVTILSDTDLQQVQDGLEKVLHAADGWHSLFIIALFSKWYEIACELVNSSHRSQQRDGAFP